MPKPRLKRGSGPSSSLEISEPESDYDAGLDEQGEHVKREIPTWEGVDTMITQEIRIVGPDGEKVDVMTFRGSFEKDIKSFAGDNADLAEAVAKEDDDAVETILQERFYNRPERYYSPDKLIVSYGVPAPGAAFVYDALGKRSLPTRDQIIADTVESIAARYDLRYTQQKLLQATASLVSDDRDSFDAFESGQYSVLFNRSQFRPLGGVSAFVQWKGFDEAFEALRQSSLIQATRQAFRMGNQ